MNIRKISVCFAMLAIVCTAFASGNVRFRDNGKFKIIQFTDTHIIWNNSKSKPAFECVKNVIEFEHPDMVVFTGDQVYGPGVENSLSSLLAIPSEKGVPFAMILGNHDDSYDASGTRMYDIAQSIDGSLMPLRTDSVFQDYAIEILGSKSGKPQYVLYCMDTHTKNSTVKGYDWLEPHQIKWYENQSEHYNRAPALLFIHIPLQEYNNAAKQKDKMVGNKKEDICSSAMNSGMFLLMRENGDVRGVFCGHDHNNDFASTFLNMLLAYGRYSGGSTVYNSLGTNGARVILLDEENPDRIETWIRLSNGKIENKYTFTKE